MKKIKYLILVMLVFFTINVKAADSCDTKELNRLKELAKKIEFDYDYTVVDGNANFSIHAINLNEELKALIIKDYYNGDYREFIGNTEATLDGFTSGERIVITIKAFVPNACSGETVFTKTIKLPYYNIFYNEKDCTGFEDFKYCKPILNNNITQKEFYDSYLAYRAEILEKLNKKDEEVTSSNMDIYFLIGGAVLIIAIIVAYVSYVVKRNKRNKL